MFTNLTARIFTLFRRRKYNCARARETWPSLLSLAVFFIFFTRLNRVNAMWWWWSINIRIVLNRLWPFLSNGDRKVSEELNEISPPALFFLYFAHYLHLKGELSGWSECNVHVDRRRHISYDLKSSTESAEYFSSVLFFSFFYLCQIMLSLLAKNWQWTEPAISFNSWV